MNQLLWVCDVPGGRVKQGVRKTGHYKIARWQHYFDGGAAHGYNGADLTVTRRSLGPRRFRGPVDR